MSIRDFNIYNGSGCLFGSVRANSYREAAEMFAANYTGHGWRVYDSAMEGYGTKGRTYVFVDFSNDDLKMYTDESCCVEYKGDE